MTCHVGENIIICDGMSGGWRVDLQAYCPWCKEPRRCVRVAIFSGWEGYDYICGTCGTYWSNNGEIYYRKLTEEKRDENIARVAATPDPQCWECHDTGDTSDPADPISEPMLRPCACPAGQLAKAETSH